MGTGQSYRNLFLTTKISAKNNLIFQSNDYDFWYDTNKNIKHVKTQFTSQYKNLR